MSTFLQMQQQLSELLEEATTGDGYWSEAIKQRFINLGVKDVMLRTKAGPLVIDISAETTAGTRTYSLPTSFLMPRKLYIDGKPYRRITEERELELLSGDLDNASTYSASADNTVPSRFYVLDLTAGQYRILPQPTAILGIRWVYMKVPTTLTASTDTPNIPTVLHELPAIWAGWQLSYRDKEHMSRGASLRNEYMLQLSQALQFLDEGMDRPEVEMTLDEKYFTDSAMIRTDFDHAD